jgi:curved DNA-binding protein CbpA
MSRIRTFYDELGVDRQARATEIKRAFRNFARQYHPDLNPPEKKAWAHEQMSRLNFIVETLLDGKSRTEYDELVQKYEREGTNRPRRTRRQVDALHREFARVSVEIMNLTGKYSNCRLKMMIGACLAVVSIGLVALGTAYGFQDINLDFIRFFALVGAITTAIGLSDLVNRKHYRQRIEELRSRQSQLRRRMYESSIMYTTD